MQKFLQCVHKELWLCVEFECFMQVWLAVGILRSEKAKIKLELASMCLGF